MQLIMKALSFFLIIFLSIGTIHSQTIINVPGDFPTIQEAINAAQANSEIKVAAGVYNENIVWPFSLNDVVLEGAGSDVTAIDGGGMDRTLELESANGVTVRGFTIQNGYVENTIVNPTPIFEANGGAGILVFGGNPILEDLVIKDNVANGRVHGAGIYAIGYQMDIRNCSFINNTITGLPDWMAYGAGMFAARSFGTFDSCEFASNKILGEVNQLSKGGGVYLEIIDNVEVLNCVFDNNLLEFGSAGGMWVSVDDIVEEQVEFNLINSEFTNNATAQNGNAAGLFLASKNLKVHIDSCNFENNQVQLENPNDATGWGGAIYSFTKRLVISNSNFENNSANRGGAVAFSINSPLEGEVEDILFESCTFTSNEAVEGAVFHTHVNFNTRTFFKNCVMTKSKGSTLYAKGLIAGGFDFFYEQIFFEHCTVAYNEDNIYFELVEFDAKNSIFWNSGEYEFVSDGSNFTLTNCVVDGAGVGQNTISMDPLFINQDELIPVENSPCISAGTEDITVDTDINGNPRPYPANTPPDIGAYELEFGISANKDLHTLDINIFPNPVADVLYFDQHVDRCKIFGLDGKQLMEGNMLQNIPVNKLEAGVYIIEVWKDGETGLLKFEKL